MPSEIFTLQILIGTCSSSYEKKFYMRHIRKYRRSDLPYNCFTKEVGGYLPLHVFALTYTVGPKFGCWRRHHTLIDTQTLLIFIGFTMLSNQDGKKTTENSEMYTVCNAVYFSNISISYLLKAFHVWHRFITRTLFIFFFPGSIRLRQLKHLLIGFFLCIILWFMFVGAYNVVFKREGQHGQLSLWSSNHLLVTERNRYLPLEGQIEHCHR